MTEVINTCPNELIAAITAAAAVIGEGKTIEQLSLLGTIFTQLGDSLSTMAAQKALCAACTSESEKPG